MFRRLPEGPVLARFYELRTNRPLYVTKGTRIQAEGLGSRILDGYELSYSPESVITHYGVLVSGRELTAIEEDYQWLAQADPAAVRRPDKLQGLSPWMERIKPEPAARVRPAEVQRAIVSLDERGAWVRPGVIGKPGRVVSVYVARPMLLRIARRQWADPAAEVETTDRVVQLRPDDTVDVFLGPEPLVEQIISSADFARNLTLLARYYAEAR